MMLVSWKASPSLWHSGGLGLGLAEDLGGDFANDARHQMAVALQPGKVEVAGLLQVHLAAVDDGQQVPRLDAVIGRQRHQGEHDRVAGLAGIGTSHFVLPPGKLGVRHTRVRHFVHHVVHLTAKGVEGSDGGAPRLGQKQEGVVKAAARAAAFCWTYCAGVMV